MRDRRDRGGDRERFDTASHEKLKVKDEDIEYKNTELLKKCVGTQGQMFSRRRTGFTNKRQRLLKNAIKRARHMGMLSFVD